MNWLEIAGTVMGILYLYWEYKASAWLWLASIAMPALYLGVYYDAGLYADFAISIYYIIASLYGLIVWLRNRQPSTENTQPNITRTPKSLYLPLTGIAIVITVVLGILLSRFTDSTVPWADAFTTSLSIVALWMLAKKYVEQWLVWIVVDAAYTILYIYKDLYPTGGLYFAYTIVAIFGYYKWKRLMNLERRQ